MGKSKIKTACIPVHWGIDRRIDQRGTGDTIRPFNPLPIKCKHCTFPDLDFVTEPYLLPRDISAPIEIVPALLGNFLVRERVRRILELVIPGICGFCPTAEAKTGKPLPWWLAVPQRQLKTAYPKPTRPFCPKCHESKDWRWNCAWPEVWAKMKKFDANGIDIFKSIEWSTIGVAEDDYDPDDLLRWKRRYPDIKPPTNAATWTRLRLERDLYFSVRLEQLLIKAKVKGSFVRPNVFDDVEPTPDDQVWIEENLKLLAKHGLLEASKSGSGKASKAAKQWFQQFLKRNTAKENKPVDFSAVEKKQGLALPRDYKAFFVKSAIKSFENVNELEEALTAILPPNKLDFETFRRGKNTVLKGADAEVDGVLFAETDFGDGYVFDVSVKGGDYPVYWWRHEEDTLEPYAPNFAECIKRFAQKN